MAKAIKNSYLESGKYKLENFYYQTNKELHERQWESFLSEIEESALAPWILKNAKDFSQKWYQGFWKRVNGICTASTCELLKEDPLFSEYLIEKLHSLDFKAAMIDQACFCEIGANTERPNEFIQVGSAASSLGLGVACAFTGGAVCIPAGIAWAGSAVVGGLNFSASAEDLDHAQIEANKKSLISLTPESYEASNNNLLQKNRAYYLDALFLGAELTGAKASLAWKKVSVPIKKGVGAVDSYASSRAIALGVDDVSDGRLWLFDLEKAGTLATRDIKKMENAYWEHVASVYKDRLNLTDDEIKGFIESSKALSSRTQLIVQTPSSQLGELIKTGEIKGGVASVMSRSNKELLPLEKATGVHIERAAGDRIVEVVRLTADNSSPTQTKTLIDNIIKLSVEKKDANRFVLYTSKVHLRLYKRLGFEMKQIAEAGDGRDVIAEFFVTK